ncbi:NAD(P)-binding protein [Pseudovirgaria hyperparasitica]|uniref:NAD(P)-binding protein n=1 Tax=Pseudovirgaria hyperparasitica TaxID=470096 RepID=A0A6A6WCM0_9PEZI|nr:NAD(P)-binding protein [Pseudovirgaria hyperparasitica]KAF2759929.1 NAD(P)-binding protein [Pseudovirgaria hyperparasitica]
MDPPFPSPVKQWHNDIYPAIEPSNPKLSHKGHTVVITGAGSGIGRANALAFAIAGAARLVLIGRTEAKIKETEAAIASEAGNCDVITFITDASNLDGMQEVARAVGTWHVLLLNAGYMNSPAPVATADLGDYWKAFEVNVKSTIVGVQSFAPTAAKDHAAIVAPVGGSMQLPTKLLAGLSGYLTAKLAVVRIMEFLSVENPSIFFATYHPGMVDTEVFRRSGATPDMLPMDSPQLSAGFVLWLTLPAALFLNGRFVWANWDVEELMASSDKITSQDLFKTSFTGWPYAST